jgi:hypothetical protein
MHSCAQPIQQRTYGMAPIRDSVTPGTSRVDRASTGETQREARFPGPCPTPALPASTRASNTLQRGPLASAARNDGGSARRARTGTPPAEARRGRPSPGGHPFERSGGAPPRLGIATGQASGGALVSTVPGQTRWSRAARFRNANRGIVHAQIVATAPDRPARVEPTDAADAVGRRGPRLLLGAAVSAASTARQA